MFLGRDDRELGRLAMRVLFTFENALPSREADAEVFTATASSLARSIEGASLHVPGFRGAEAAVPSELAEVRALAPPGPAALRHLCCGLTIVWRRAFRDADLVYTRNLWIATITLLFGQRVVFDHYRPWPDQIPPLRPLLRALMGHERFLLNICHSDYTRVAYRRIGVPARKLATIRNGFEPERLRNRIPIERAKASVGVEASQRTVVYTGRINRRKGLDLLIEAASRLPDLLFLLVGAEADQPPDLPARPPANVRLVPWQTPEGLARHLAAADVLVIPPSTRPLREFGSTVLPLKVFLYMASGRPILAGATPDVEEVLRHRENAFLAAPDDPDALASGLATLVADEALGARLAAAAYAESRELTWDARAARILAAMDERLRLTDEDVGPVGAACDPSTGSERRAWLVRCGRWLVHLIREGSMVLPPSPRGP